MSSYIFKKHVSQKYKSLLFSFFELSSSSFVFIIYSATKVDKSWNFFPHLHLIITSTEPFFINVILTKGISLQEGHNKFIF